ncbi:MAG: tetratricopeptide repeat protein [Bacillota bacterium]
MFEVMEVYIKNRADQVVFLQLKEGGLGGLERFQYLEGLPIPILVNELADLVKNKDGQQDIPLASIARGMVFLMGLDKEFKHLSLYKRFLYDFDEQIEDYIAYEGIKLAEQGELYTALIYFHSLVQLNKDNLNGVYNYGRCCYDIAEKSHEAKVKSDFTKEATAVFELLAEEFPEFSASHYYLGFLYAKQKMFKKAQLTWEECLGIGIDEDKEEEIRKQLIGIRDQIQYEEGYTLALGGHPEKGLEKLIPLLEKYHDWWNLTFLIGFAYRQCGNYTEAIRYLEKVLTMVPNQVDTLNELGICYASIGEMGKAEMFLKKALVEKANDSEIICNLGMVYMEMDRYDEAEEIFEESLRINPDDEVTKQCIEELKKRMNGI